MFYEPEDYAPDRRLGLGCLAGLAMIALPWVVAVVVEWWVLGR